MCIDKLTYDRPSWQRIGSHCQWCLFASPPRKQRRRKGIRVWENEQEEWGNDEGPKQIRSRKGELRDRRDANMDLMKDKYKSLFFQKSDSQREESAAYFNLIYIWESFIGGTQNMVINPSVLQVVKLNTLSNYWLIKMFSQYMNVDNKSAITA